MIFSIFGLSFALLVLPFTIYGYGEKYTTPQKANVDCQKSATPLSWHVHVTYMLTNDDQIEEVTKFREQAMEYFAPMLGSDPICRGTKEDPSGRYGNNKFIVI